MAASASILCATDFSEPARVAAHRAAHLARDAAAPLTLMHVVPERALDELRRRVGAAPASEQPMHDSVQERLGQLAAELSAAWQVEVRTMHAVGAPVDEIIFEARALPASVVVLGARGAGTLRRLVLGTTSERLLRRTTAGPILVARQPPEVPYRRVLVGVDFSPSSVPVLQAARHCAPTARLILLHALETDLPPRPTGPGAQAPDGEHGREQARQEAAAQLQQVAGAAGLADGTWEACVADGDASAAILGQAHRCDLVVLGKHGRTLREDLLLGSATQHVLAEGATDVLIVPGGGA